MSKKTFFVRLFGIMTLSILFSAALAYGAQYYNQYSGNSFQPQTSYSVFGKNGNGSIFRNDYSNHYYFCPVNFNVRDGSTYFIKSIGIRYKDNLTDGYLLVRLIRLNLYTGNYHIVASWSSSIPDASSSDQTASKGTTAGYKLVDTKKFAYWLEIRFDSDEYTNPSYNLKIYQVRIHYGT